MKARTPPVTRLTRREKEAVDAYLAAERTASTRRIFKIMCLVFNRKHGHGVKRGMETIEEIGTLAAEHEHDEAFWWHVDRELEKIGYDFDREDYEVVDR